MTDKPLDCIGLQSTRHIGKHDFRQRNIPTTNAMESLTPMALGSLDAAVKMLKDHEQQARRSPASGKATEAFLNKLKASVAPIPEVSPVDVCSFFGFPIHLANDLPPGVMAEFRNADGEVVGRITE
ncbi:MAG: hypothetical protein K8U57_27420 [Planctomycetes bacterium]|nr:hypothetical protein [Planctomycetota bacterium]